jgi:hypothetical protein
VEKLMGSTLGALVELEDSGMTGHGDISLESIYYSKRERGFKVAHPVFSPESGYQLARNGKRFSALAPEQLSALADGSEADEISLKADLFALGVALCEVLLSTRRSAPSLPLPTSTAPIPTASST